MKNREKIDAYLKNRMGHQQRIVFEREIESDKALAKEVQEAKIKLQEAEHADTKEWTPQNNNSHNDSCLKKGALHKDRKPTRLFARKTNLYYKYLGGIGLAVGIFFIILLFDVFTSYDYDNNERIENIMKLKRPHNLDYYMKSGLYEEALLTIDSLEKDLLLTYSKSTIKEDHDSLRKCKLERKKRTSLILYELTWDKINVYLGLEEYDKALFLLNHFKDKEGTHQEEAQNYWNELE